MRSLRSVLRVLAVTLLAGASFVARAEASPIVTINPTPVNVGVGDNFFVDVNVANVTEAIGAYSFLLNFNNAIISGNTLLGQASHPGLTVAGGGQMGPVPVDLSLGFAGGTGSPVDVFIAADPAVNAPTLFNLQKNGFTLARVFFHADAAGTTALTLTGLELSGFQDPNATVGAPPLAVQFTNGRVCVGANCDQQVPVPEPATLTMLGAGVAALVARRRRRVSPEA